LRQVLALLVKNGLRINADKCVFFSSSVEFLGHQVDRTGIRPLQNHVEAVLEFPAATTAKELQRFLGLINFYRRFIPKAALLMKPLTDALVGAPKIIRWSEELQEAFEAAKKAVAGAMLLSHPQANAEVSLATDASNSHVGAVLQQRQGNVWAPLAFFSKKLNSAQKNYSTFDRELLAIVMAIRHFHFFFEGRVFTVYTDHKPLTTALHRVTPPVSARQQRCFS
jgi:hypothetical protein